MGDITKMEVWKISLDLATTVYEMTQRGNLSNDFSFRDQIRRSAVSIPSNIAEGLESGFDKLGVRYFYNAKGSVAELRMQIFLATKIGYIQEEEYKELLLQLELIAKMLSKLIAYRKNLINK